jgi:NifU-like protein involved in Fe-S cluster formation
MIVFLCFMLSLIFFFFLAVPAVYLPCLILFSSEVAVKMRFLLHPIGRSARSLNRDGKGKAGSVKVKNNIANGVSASATKIMSADVNPHVKTWGQQCSPNCGCVVRFESKIDPSTQTITEASYVAKSVIAAPKGGRLEPLLTTRSNRPMFKECGCTTIHRLAQEITDFLPNQKFHRVRNMTEFTSARSSPAFRHAVLTENRLPKTDIQCFDLLEEAFTAMIKGHMPKPRRNSEHFYKSLSKAFAKHHAGEDAEDFAERGRHEYGSDRTRLSLSSPRAMSTLSMFDINAEAWEYEQQSNRQYANRPKKSSPSFDWVTYVDEQYQKEESA